MSQKPLSPRFLAKQLCVETSEIRKAVEHIREQIVWRGVVPTEVAGGYQLRTKPAHAELLREFLRAKPTKFSRAALETLAIVAYKQPLTRAEVEDIRGVDSGAVLRRLLEQRLLKILGRKEEPGRPILYGTSPSFLEHFGLKSLKELPTLREFVELSEEHARLVDREAPDEEEQATQRMQSYIEEMGEMGYEPEAEQLGLLDTAVDEESEVAEQPLDEEGDQSE